jgi:dTDP-4-amino-4,6-dideoxygalactose transaminase
VASANCALYCGAAVDFVDIDPRTWNLSVSALEEKLDRAKKEGSLPDVVVPVHFAGQPTEQEEIWDLAKEYGFKVLEDASHSIGASRRGEPVGSCRWSDITIFSFHPVKIITTAEGGVALTNDKRLAERMALFRSQGITRDPVLLQGDPRPWYYEQQELGFNYRMTDIQAALGASQLQRLSDFVSRRNDLAAYYDRELQDLPLRLPTVKPENRSAFHLYVVRVPLGHSRRPYGEVFEALRERGVGVNLHYLPVHLQPYYRRLGFARGQFPEAEKHGQSAITLPLFPSLTRSDQDVVVRALKESL